MTLWGAREATIDNVGKSTHDKMLMNPSLLFMLKFDHIKKTVLSFLLSLQVLDVYPC